MHKWPGNLGSCCMSRLWCREEEAVNEAELSPEEFQIRKERMKAMREQVHLWLLEHIANVPKPKL